MDALQLDLEVDAVRLLKRLQSIVIRAVKLQKNFDLKLLSPRQALLLLAANGPILRDERGWRFSTSAALGHNPGGSDGEGESDREAFPLPPQHERKHALLRRLSSLQRRKTSEGLLRDYVGIWDDFDKSEVFDEWLESNAWHLNCYGGPRSGKTTFAAAIAKKIGERLAPTAGIFTENVFTVDILSRRATEEEISPDDIGYGDDGISGDRGSDGEDANVEIVNAQDFRDDSQDPDDPGIHEGKAIEDAAPDDPGDTHDFGIEDAAPDDPGDTHDFGIDDAVPDDENAPEIQQYAIVSLFFGPEASALLRNSYGRITIKSTLRAILRQLLEWSLTHNVDTRTWDRLPESEAELSRLSLNTFREHVVHDVQQFHKVFILVDGLDCIENDALQKALSDELLRLKKMVHDGQHIVRLLFIQSKTEVLPPDPTLCDSPGCGRDISIYWRCTICNNGCFDLCRRCREAGNHCDDKQHEMREPYPCRELYLQLRGGEHELVRFLQEKLENEKSQQTAIGRRIESAGNIVQRIEQEVENHSAGLLVLAKLFMDSITRKQPLEKIFDVLDSLPEHETQYFHSMMHEVTHQHAEHDRTRGLAAINLVAHASLYARPLSLEELEGALQIFLKDQYKNDDYSPSLTAHHLLKITKEFVRFEGPKNDELELLHADARTYILENCTETICEQKLDMASLCLDSIFQASDDLCSVEGNVDALHGWLSSHPFVFHSLQNWGKHLFEQFTDRACERAITFLEEYQRLPRLRQATFLALAVDSDGERTVSHELHLIVSFGLVEVLEQFSLRHPDIDMNVVDARTGQTALHLACQSCDYDTYIVERLLEYGVDCHVQDRIGRTALWVAVENGCLEKTRTLLDSISQRTSRIEALNARNPYSDNQTLLMLAVRRHHDALVNLLLAYPGIDVDARDSRNMTALHLAVCDMLHTTDDFSEAITESIPALIDLFRAAGADIHLSGQFGRSLLHFAAFDDGQIDTLRHLLDTTDLDINARDVAGRTALHIAAGRISRAEEAVRLLVARGADLSLPDSNGYLAYQAAKALGSSSISHLQPSDLSSSQPSSAPLCDLAFTDAGALLEAVSSATCCASSLSQTDALGWNLFHCAISTFRLDTLSALLQALPAASSSLLLSAYNLSGDTALHSLASWHASPPHDNESLGPVTLDLASLLLPVQPETSPLLSSLDRFASSPLLLALSSDHFELVLFFLSRGAAVPSSLKTRARLLRLAIRAENLCAAERLMDEDAVLDIWTSVTDRRLVSQACREEDISDKTIEWVRDRENAVLRRIVEERE